MYIFTSALSLLPFLALVGNTYADACTGNPSDTLDCTILTYTDTTTKISNAPTPGQCDDTCSHIFGDAGDWIVDFRGQPDGYIDHPIGNPCQLRIGRGQGEPKDYYFFMTNQDMANIIGEVEKRFGGLHNGKVAAQGTMECGGHKAVWYVD
ncbi:hypothetical protein EJ04DRAFT_593461 [Polyplosphaeria fusca]|uniref:Ecp2 effector protein-like domain-containing protein n=1 Tax=Polyplosphaeria fusca TaxID=682080 RepID=A0A9P4QN59_9PLEO|nr:hypothetical protein EJ04DRAFT_593461 [Polyplosphaeria fusca]